MTQRYYDICVVGGGILGSFVAKNCAKRWPGASVALFESEQQLHTHNSSRNSGVLHSGLYYAPDTLKARMSVAGTKAMKDYCKEHNIPISNCGKLVVPTNEPQHQTLETLLEQGRKNGVEVEKIDAASILRMEPCSNPNDSFKYALFSPSTSVTSISGILEAVKLELSQLGNLEVCTGEGFLRAEDTQSNRITFQTQAGKISCSRLVNAAGFDSVRVAQEWGYVPEYMNFSLRGFYLKASLQELSDNNFAYPKILIYPVPPEKNSMFLGAHSTTTLDGYLKFGPIAIPGFSGRHFETFKTFDAKDVLKTIQFCAKFLGNANFLHYCRLFKEQAELTRKSRLLDKVSDYIRTDPSQKYSDMFHWQNGGVRTLVYNRKTASFEKDFIFLNHRNQIHIMNYASPGWTCAIPISEMVTEMITL